MSDVIMLTREERERFAAWLEQDAAGTEGLIEQMRKLPGLHLQLLAGVKQKEADAQRAVARMLRATEGM